jgi:Co/Zn/Cd efflux system component
MLGVGVLTLIIGTGTAWPDLAVAAIMGTLALSSAWQVIRQARSELAQTPAPAEDPAR